MPLMDGLHSLVFFNTTHAHKKPVCVPCMATTAPGAQQAEKVSPRACHAHGVCVLCYLCALHCMCLSHSYAHNDTHTHKHDDRNSHRASLECLHTYHAGTHTTLVLISCLHPHHVCIHVTLHTSCLHTRHACSHIMLARTSCLRTHHACTHIMFSQARL